MKRKTLLALAAIVAVLAALVAASISAAAPAGAASFTLYAGKTTPVGTVYVWNDATNLYVEIDMDSGWCMTESHVAAASTVAGIPQNSQQNPTPGQFPYGDTYNPCESGGDTFTIPLAGLGSTPVIAVHAVVWGADTCRTIVSNAGDSIVKSLAYPVSGSAVPAVVTPGYAGWPPIPGASYISDQTAGDPFNINVWRKVTETLAVPGLPISGSLMVNSDNYEFTKLNGAEIERDDNGPTATVENTAPEPVVSPQTWSTITTIPFTPVKGANTFEFVSRNVTWAGGGSFVDNPAGLIYEARACYYTRSESAWAGSAVGQTQFNPSKSWATYVNYTLQDVLLETVTVPAALPNGPAGATSTTVLASGSKYLFKVTGTVIWTNRNGANEVDTECTAETPGVWTANALGYPDDLLELQVDSLDRNWDPLGTINGAGCSVPDHEYTLPWTGAGSTVTFRIYDGVGNVQDPGWFGDNAGSLTVQIWLDL